MQHHPAPILDERWQGFELARDDEFRYVWIWQGFNIRLIAVPTARTVIGATNTAGATRATPSLSRRRSPTGTRPPRTNRQAGTSGPPGPPGRPPTATPTPPTTGPAASTAATSTRAAAP
ncbi:hypothetical protein ACR6C2_08415 [Streptomyces sp. INA 01156]